MIFIYRALTFFFYPFFIILIYLRTLNGKEDKKRYKEKIFSTSSNLYKNKNKKNIWFHAASIGEVQSIFSFINKLDKKKFNFLITTITKSSAEIVKKEIKLNRNIQHRYFPLDTNFLIKSFLNSWNPSVAIFIDSEIWPNTLFELKNRNIPSILINARITNKTFKKWSLLSFFAKEVFNKFDLCLTANNETKKYLYKLNARNIKYIGNLKLATSINVRKIHNINKKILLQKKFWCAASTHQGEETLCINSHVDLKKRYEDILTIIIPRHINRSREIKAICNNFKLSSQILNENDLIKENKEIIIINSFGNLPKYFKYTKSVFMGKSFLKNLKKVGGQNPIEAAKFGCKIYHGPYVYNFNEIYKLFKTYKISKEVKNWKELSNNLILDLNLSKKNNIKYVTIINDLGKKVLNRYLKETKRILND